MKIKGEFTLREVAGEILVIPVGTTALEFNGMIILNPVSKTIWECLQENTTAEQILCAVMDAFEVDVQQAREDIAAFLDDLRSNHFLEE